ncbi:MAG: E3 binding domain-containing protein [Verrucomicrobia bacterium]|nr:E3 binding domain-containing protein [Verrucomicrobiota bacterium]MDA1085982.1 E3 binding domain-containing protein [Verrucomicrobiota bacterium]
MPIEVIVPRQGWSMEEGIFVEWLKQEGERVEEGDMLFVLETDKAQQEVESFDSGLLYVPADAPQAGDTVTLGQRLGYLLADGEDPPAVSESARPTPTPSTKSEPTEAFVPQAAQHAPVTRSTGKTISPRAARLAAELDIDWRAIAGTGRSGRIRETDILSAAERNLKGT